MDCLKSIFLHKWHLSINHNMTIIVKSFCLRMIMEAAPSMQGTTGTYHISH